LLILFVSLVESFPGWVLWTVRIIKSTHQQLKLHHPLELLYIRPTAKMGQNLSLSEKFADTSKATLAPWDRNADIIVGVIWACCLYAIGMIWCAVGLLRRWSGPDEERGVNIFSVLAAFLLSSGWPVILLYFAMSSRG
jgi:hypothetical protein